MHANTNLCYYNFSNRTGPRYAWCYIISEQKDSPSLTKKIIISIEFGSRHTLPLVCHVGSGSGSGWSPCSYVAPKPMGVLLSLPIPLLFPDAASEFSRKWEGEEGWTATKFTSWASEQGLWPDPVLLAGELRPHCSCRAPAGTCAEPEFTAHALHFHNGGLQSWIWYKLI